MGSETDADFPWAFGTALMEGLDGEGECELGVAGDRGVAGGFGEPTVPRLGIVLADDPPFNGVFSLTMREGLLGREGDGDMCCAR